MLGVAVQAVGGLGIFLIAMQMMTDGVRLAAGDALRDMLGHWTCTTPRGLLAGLAITVLVQSSSAVTVATIGFVNAGVLTITEAIGVVYGSNIGTTVTGWLVAAIGFRIDIAVVALPLIGIGAALRLSGATRRRGALGEAIAGFGLFFIGIDFLKTAFEGMAQSFDLMALSQVGIFGAMGLAFGGFLMTFLTQSSSAAIAITLTAASGGVLTFTAAAAVVIGANVGTTTTAVLATIGATPNAKRIAAAHVGFNLLTAVVAMALLASIPKVFNAAESTYGLPLAPAFSLALFHTFFNILGVAILWPFTRRVSVFLATRFRSAEEDEARPRFLDHTLVGTPSLGLNAIAFELHRVGQMIRSMVDTTIAFGPERRLVTHRSVVDSLVNATADFVTRLQGAKLSVDVVELLPRMLRISRYFQASSALSLRLAEMQDRARPIADSGLRMTLNRFRARVADLLLDAAAQGPATALNNFEHEYHAMKGTLLSAGASGLVSIAQMAEELENLSVLRRMVEQYLKGLRSLDEMRGLLGITWPPGVSPGEASANRSASPDQATDGASDPYGESSDAEGLPAAKTQGRDR